jgi:hypothetical protein
MSPPTENYELPPDKDAALRRAKRTEWAALLLPGHQHSRRRPGDGVVADDEGDVDRGHGEPHPLLGIPAGAYFRIKKPNENFPYGYRRAVLIAYLAGSVALFGFGLWILGDSIYKLVTREHPSIQTVEIFGHRIWLGWLMMAALIYSVIPPFILGRVKHRLALELSDKALETSGRIDRATGSPGWPRWPASWASPGATGGPTRSRPRSSPSGSSRTASPACATAWSSS